MPPLTHAKLSASSAYRWMPCPGSIPFGKLYPDNSSEFADEGGFAHALGELYIKKNTLGEKVDAEIEDLEKQISRFYHNHPDMGASLGDMRYFAKEYADFVDEWHLPMLEQSALMLEHKFSLDKYIPEGFGTSDATVIRGKTLHIIDLKYGKGIPVEAKHNPQLMIYALGMYTNYVEPFDYDIETVRLSIFQPRLYRVSEWDIPLTELLEWAETELRPAALVAYAEVEKFEAGDWCRFCPAKAACKTRADYVLQLKSYLSQHTLSDEELADVLTIGKSLQDFLSGVQQTATDRLLEGETVPGFKLVESQTRRAWVNSDNVKRTLKERGYNPQDFEENVLMSASKIRKVVDKDTYEALQDYITRPKGRPVAAPLDDKRNDFKGDTENG